MELSKSRRDYDKKHQTFFWSYQMVYLRSVLSKRCTHLIISFTYTSDHTKSKLVSVVMYLWLPRSASSISPFYFNYLECRNLNCGFRMSAVDPVFVTTTKFNKPCAHKTHFFYGQISWCKTKNEWSRWLWISQYSSKGWFLIGAVLLSKFKCRTFKI